MGKSKVVRRKDLVRDNEFEKGFGVYSLICGETCGSKSIMLGHTIHNPASRNQEHVHLGCEVQWYVLKGHSLHYSCTVDHEEYKETECFPGTVGFVARNEIHVGMNLNPEDTGEIIFCYAGCNSTDDAETVFYQDTDVVREHMAKHGKKLEDVLEIK